MLSTPNPNLSEEERDLFLNRPEAYLRHAVAQGTVSLDSITENLTPRAADAVRGMVSAERAIQPSCAPRSGNAAPLPITPYPSLQQLLDEGTLDPEEVLAASQSIDAALGRYLTGTRYAAP